MLANFFGKSKPVNFILIMVLFLSYYVLDLFTHKQIEFNVEFLFVMPLVLGMFFFFNFIIVKNKLTHDNLYAFFLFVVGIGFFPEIILNYKQVIYCVLLILFFRRLYSLRTSNSIYAKIFDSGMWLGVLFLFTPNYIIYLVVLYFAILFFLKLTFRTLFIPLLGFVTPILLYFTYHFYNSNLLYFDDFFNFTFSFNNNVSTYKVILMLFGVFSMISISLKSKKIFSVSNHFKKSWALLLIHFFIATVLLLITSESNELELMAFVFPASILVANWIQSIKNKLIVNIVLLLFLISSIAIHFIA